VKKSMRILYRKIHIHDLAMLQYARSSKNSIA
jgi:hypothetical protein